MITVLVSIIILNSSIVSYLWMKNAASKTAHLQKTEALQAIIVELLKIQNTQSEKIQLADELKDNLRFSKNRLNSDILALQYEFLDILTRHGLLE